MDEKYSDNGILDIGNAVSIRLMFHPLNWIRLIVEISEFNYGICNNPSNCIVKLHSNGNRQFLETSLDSSDIELNRCSHCSYCCLLLEQALAALPKKLFEIFLLLFQEGFRTRFSNSILNKWIYHRKLFKLLFRL